MVADPGQDPMPPVGNRLKHGVNCGDPAKAPRCGARTRLGAACGQPAMANARCRLYGGKVPARAPPKGWNGSGWPGRVTAHTAREPARCGISSALALLKGSRGFGEEHEVVGEDAEGEFAGLGCVAARGQG